MLIPMLTRETPVWKIAAFPASVDRPKYMPLSGLKRAIPCYNSFHLTIERFVTPAQPAAIHAAKLFARDPQSGGNPGGTMRLETVLKTRTTGTVTPTAAP